MGSILLYCLIGIGIGLIIIIFILIVLHKKKGVNIDELFKKSENLENLTGLIKDPELKRLSESYNNLNKKLCDGIKELNERITKIEDEKNSYLIKIDKLNQRISGLEKEIKNVKKQNLELRIENETLKRTV